MYRPPFCVIFLTAVLPVAAASLTVRASVQSPAYVGDSIGWQADAGGSSPSQIRYRFRVREPRDSQFRIVRDFSSRSDLVWTPLREGNWEIEFAARNTQTGEMSVAVEAYTVASRTAQGAPAVSATSNSLVYLYSAPPCPGGSRISAVFTGSDGVPHETPSGDCVEGESLNFYLAGMRAESDYFVVERLTAPDGTIVERSPLAFRTSPLDVSLPATRTMTRSARAQQGGVLFQNRVFNRSVATDLDGNIIWYYPEVTPYLTRPEPGGYFFAMMEKHGGTDEDQLLRLVDLAGNPVWETNAARINEQLAAQGRQPVTSFHHEARRLPDGRILVLAATERLITGMQGEGPVSIMGDAILVLNQDLEVVWAWDAFDHMDVRRAALQGETCVVGQGGCAVFHLADQTNDWLHGNSLALTPDGNLIYSARHQDWIIKIDYANGTGSGNVLWRLGAEGDFRLASGDPNVWFSHQHDAGFVPCELGHCLLLFDNNNARTLTDESAHSRGQLWYLDEEAMTARLLMDLDVTNYSFALGSAQRLPNGNLFFNSGIDPERRSVFIEFAADGEIVSRMEADTATYRTHRMKDMYTPW